MSPVSEPQPGLIFGGILSRDARQRLTRILSELSDIQAGSSARTSLIATAGLFRYLNLDYAGTARDFAGRLVAEAEHVGIIEDQEGTYYALEILLNYLLNLEHLPPRHRPFFTSLITQYEQSTIQSRLDALQSVLRPDEGNIGNSQAVVQADIGRDARATDSESITFDFTKLLWFKYVVWIIVLLVPWLAAVAQLFELSPCLYFPFAGIFAFFGGIVMLTKSLIRHNQHRYSNWERGITFTVTILATVFFALLGLNSCADSPRPPQVLPTTSDFDYTVLVQEDEWPYEKIIGAYVELRLSPAVTGYTEDSGRATLRLNAAYYDYTVVLDVTKSGFKPRSLEVKLVPDVEPIVIRLEKDQSAPTDPTPSAQASELNAAEQAEVTRPPSPQPSDTTSSTSSDPTPETINESGHIPPPTATIREQEPNSEYWEADGPIASNRSNYGYQNDEKDYWTLYMSSPGKITLDLANTSAPSQLQLFYNIPSETTRIAYVFEPPYHIEHTGAAGLYYIMVGTTSGFNNLYPYTLRAQFPTQEIVSRTPASRPREYLEEWVGYNFEENTENWWSAQADFKLATVEISQEEACRGSHSLKLTTELKPNAGNVYLHTSPTVYFDNGIPQGMDEPGPYDLTGKRISCHVLLPDELATEEPVQVHVNLFIKDEDFRNQYSSNLYVTEDMVNSWQELSLVVGEVGDGYIDAGFETENVNALGVVINLESWASLNFTGFIYIDECRIEYP